MRNFVLNSYAFVVAIDAIIVLLGLIGRIPILMKFASVFIGFGILFLMLAIYFEFTELSNEAKQANQEKEKNEHTN